MVYDFPLIREVQLQIPEDYDPDRPSRRPPMSARLYAMTCGWLTMPMPMLLHGTKGTLKIPIPAYFIRHAQGTAVFDSGMSLELQREGAKALGPMEPYFDVHFEPNEEISARLGEAE